MTTKEGTPSGVPSLISMSLLLVEKVSPMLTPVTDVAESIPDPPKIC